MEYDEFKAINAAGFLAESKNPHFNWKYRFPAYDQKHYEEVSNDNLSPEVFVTSDVR